MIYIVRHGQTEKNRAKLLQGRSDAPLNEAGIRQAEELRAAFAKAGNTIDRVYSSPMGRAVQTAAIIADGITPETDDRLIEMDYGPYEGMDLTNPAPEVIYFFQDFVNHPAPEGMEPFSAWSPGSGHFLKRSGSMRQSITF